MRVLPVLVLLVLTSCAAAEPPPPAAAPMVLDPVPPIAAPSSPKPAARPVLPPEPEPTVASAEAVARDSAVLREQARSYVAAPESTAEVIDRLTILVMRSNVALDQLDLHRVGKKYRPEDIAAARAAADALAQYIHTRARQ